MLGRLALFALLLPACLADNWKTEHRDPIDVTLDDIEPGLRVAVEEDQVVLSLAVDRDEGECFYVTSMRVTMDGIDGAVNGGAWSRNFGTADTCAAPRASFKLPKPGPASFVVFSGDPSSASRWTMDVELTLQPFTWSDSTRVYHPGDTVSINVPALGAAQTPTIVISNAELGVQIDSTDIVRDGTEARFELPELPGVRTFTTATMDVFAMVSPTVVHCDAPKGCGANAFRQTLSSSISLAP
jgi:hypothetical protein